VKFCKDCRHFKPKTREAPPSLDICRRNIRPAGLDRVSGKPTFEGAPMMAAYERYKGDCGEDAKFFEPKPAPPTPPGPRYFRDEREIFPDADGNLPPRRGLFSWLTK
jgi:hypothetical protein